ncbi:MAG TPA: site-specific integrase, partial [Candidatus Dormibacteraeota bacterium]|nr:site-specific integrase [Candidatus Dormibacteraeota bacterium]
MTTDDFQLHGKPRSGIPFLLHDDMSINEPPTEWLLDLASRGGGERYSVLTLRTYAEALDDFFQTVEESQWSWDEITCDDIDEYIARSRTG